MKHSYRDSNGRFAKKPTYIGNTYPITEDDGCAAPIITNVQKNRSGFGAPIITSLQKNRDAFVGYKKEESCPICDTIDQFKSDPMRSPYTPPNSEFETEDAQEKFFSSAPHHGKPNFLNIRSDQRYNIRITGDYMKFKQTFPQTKEPTRKIQRYMLNVWDHEDKSHKVLVCGNMMMREIWREMQSVLNAPEPKLNKLQAFKKWFKEKVLRQSFQKAKDKPFDVTVERIKGSNPKDIRYKVRQR